MKWVKGEKKVGDQVLVWTKDANHLPVTSTKLEYEPCMKPGETSVSPNQTWYLLENHSNGCTKDKATGSNLVTDPRYRKTGFAYSEYDLQDESNVFDILEVMA